jgi:hypothetical protein
MRGILNKEFLPEWTHAGEIFKDQDIIDNDFGFIYLISYKNGEMYVGKKNFHSRTTCILPKTLKEPVGTYEKFNRIIIKGLDGKIVTSKANRAIARKSIQEVTLFNKQARKLNKKSSEPIEMMSHLYTSEKIVYCRIKKESNWKKYKGSSKIKNIHIKSREIICFGTGKKNLSYLETKELFKRDVLEDKMYLNGNISGVFFKE